MMGYSNQDQQQQTSINGQMESYKFPTINKNIICCNNNPSKYLQTYQNYFESVEQQCDEIIRDRLSNPSEKYAHKLDFLKEGHWKQAELLDFQNLTMLLFSLSQDGRFAEYNVIVGQCKLCINLLNVQRRAPLETLKIAEGGYGKIYLINFSFGRIAIAKRTLFKQKYMQKIDDLKMNIYANKYQIQESITQYCMYKICSFFGIGPRTIDIGFDMVCFTNSIQFYMEQCTKINPKVGNLEHQLQICLRILHKLKIVHKDVKLSNIMFSPYYNRHVICDFGISHTLTEKLGQLSKTYRQGTPFFMSEEMKAIVQGSIGYVDLFYNDLYGLNMSIHFIKQNYEQAKEGERKPSVNYEYANIMILNFIMSKTSAKEIAHLILQYGLIEGFKQYKFGCLNQKLREVVSILRLSNNYIQYTIDQFSILEFHIRMFQLSEILFRHIESKLNSFIVQKLKSTLKLGCRLKEGPFMLQRQYWRIQTKQVNHQINFLNAAIELTLERLDLQSYGYYLKQLNNLESDKTLLHQIHATLDRNQDLNQLICKTHHQISLLQRAIKICIFKNKPSDALKYGLLLVKEYSQQNQPYKQSHFQGFVMVVEICVLLGLYKLAKRFVQELRHFCIYGKEYQNNYCQILKNFYQSFELHEQAEQISQAYKLDTNLKYHVQTSINIYNKQISTLNSNSCFKNNWSFSIALADSQLRNSNSDTLTYLNSIYHQNDEFHISNFWYFKVLCEYYCLKQQIQQGLKQLEMAYRIAVYMQNQHLMSVCLLLFTRLYYLICNYLESIISSKRFLQINDYQPSKIIEVKYYQMLSYKELSQAEDSIKVAQQIIKLAHNEFLMSRHLSHLTQAYLILKQYRLAIQLHQKHKMESQSYFGNILYLHTIIAKQQKLNNNKDECLKYLLNCTRILKNISQKQLEFQVYLFEISLMFNALQCYKNTVYLNHLPLQALDRNQSQNLVLKVMKKKKRSRFVFQYLHRLDMSNRTICYHLLEIVKKATHLKSGKQIITMIHVIRAKKNLNCNCENCQELNKFDVDKIILEKIKKRKQFKLCLLSIFKKTLRVGINCETIRQFVKTNIKKLQPQ